MSSDHDHERFFPYDEPYDHQREAIDGIAAALEDDSDVLLEGATGTGKTLAALTPALEHARRTDKTVVITTNVHQQMRQFTEEARAINRQESIRAIVFRGKASMCHIDVGYEECQALRDTTHDLVDAESERADLERRQRELLDESQAGDGEAAEARSAIMDELESVGEELETLREEQSTCDHYYHNLTSDTDDFYAWLYDDVRTPDEVYEYAERQGFCGYELLKDGIDGADLVICNYHHLLDPFVREQFFRWLGRDPEDVIAVFDEAHNVADAARDHARRTLAEPTLERAIDELEGSDDPRADAAQNVLTTILTALRDTYEDALAFGERETVEDDWHDLAIDNDDRRDDLTLSILQNYTGQGVSEDLASAIKLGQALDQQYEDAYKEGETSVRKECPTLQAATFFDAWLDESDESGLYPVVSVRREEGDGDLSGRAELYTAIPDRVTRSLFDDLYATVLMSATLRPFEVTEDVLGLDEPETLAYGPQFPEDRRRTYAVDTPALFSSRRDDEGVQSTVGGVIEDAVRMTPGNTLAFFPSYAEAERYHDRVNVDATRYLDEPGTRAQELRETFTEDDDGVLFTSLWGTLGEGVSYDGDDARTALVVGVPYPYLDERMEAVQAAYETAFDGEEAGWRYAVEIPTVRKTRQAMGRVIRSPEDFGARVLIDRRYTEEAEIEMSEYAVRGTFPPAERAEMIDVDPEKLKFGLLNFYTDMDAYDGDPPAP
ncbi:ATP-dependent DNA helicase [Halorhabdus salina]|uniref:ATP-dependent DNA helicase n=1 Tax=Halorhabdus salina TaxID=2750670 RepID=UPI0015EF55D0|nr:ATP-dependent DNA helicase [Halorhabdus salina]